MTKHGMDGTPVYKAWIRMRQRCQNPTIHCWKDYGGRGISVCARWQDFAAFYEDMGDRPDGYSLDRIDNNGNYEPGNCRWAPRSVQNRNYRRNRVISHAGKTMTLTDWAAFLGMKEPTLRARVVQRGWSIERAFYSPLRGQNNTLAEAVFSAAVIQAQEGGT